MPNKKIHKLFPSPIFQCQIDDYEKLNEELQDYIYNLEKNDTKGVNASNAGGGWHSPYWQIAKSPIAKKFADSISPVLFEIITKDYAWKCKPEEIIFEGMWSIINRKSSYNVRHFHPNCHLSAAYYVKAEQDAGNIVFFDPRQANVFHHPTSKEVNKINAQVQSITPKAGTLVLFPSYLEHKVNPNLSNEDRIVISFNVSLIKKKDLLK